MKRIGSLTCTTLAVFLFSYSVSLSLISHNDYTRSQTDLFSRSGNLPVNPDGQSPFEEKEEEAGDEFQDAFQVVCVPTEILSLLSVKNQFYSTIGYFGSENFLTHLPLYLVKRALII